MIVGEEVQGVKESVTGSRTGLRSALMDRTLWASSAPFSTVQIHGDVRGGEAAYPTFNNTITSSASLKLFLTVHLDLFSNKAKTQSGYKRHPLQDQLGSECLLTAVTDPKDKRGKKKFESHRSERKQHRQAEKAFCRLKKFSLVFGVRK